MTNLEVSDSLDIETNTCTERVPYGVCLSYKLNIIFPCIIGSIDRVILGNHAFYIKHLFVQHLVNPVRIGVSSAT